VTLPVYEVIAGDPDLPAELLMPNWPGDQAGPVLRRAFRVFRPMTDDYLASLAD
jgi:DNA-binding transcriptional regulator PaaX